VRRLPTVHISELLQQPLLKPEHLPIGRVRSAVGQIPFAFLGASRADRRDEPPRFQILSNDEQRNEKEAQPADGSLARKKKTVELLRAREIDRGKSIVFLPLVPVA
jgi:hypothetical protein